MPYLPRHFADAVRPVLGRLAKARPPTLPAKMRIFARRERPHLGAQLTLFEAADGWRYSLW